MFKYISISNSTIENCFRFRNKKYNGKFPTNQFEMKIATFPWAKIEIASWRNFRQEKIKNPKIRFWALKKTNLA